MGKSATAPHTPDPPSERIIMKAAGREGDTAGAQPDASASTDVARAAIVCERFADMVKVVKLAEKYLLFAKDRHKRPTAGGWADLLLLLRINGAIVEVQVIHRRMRCRVAPW